MKRYILILALVVVLVVAALTVAAATTSSPKPDAYWGSLRAPTGAYDGAD